MSGPLFTVDCTCGRRVVIDSDTMRKVEVLNKTEAPYRLLVDPHNPALTRRVPFLSGNNPEDAA